MERMYCKTRTSTVHRSSCARAVSALTAPRPAATVHHYYTCVEPGIPSLPHSLLSCVANTAHNKPCSLPSIQDACAHYLQSVAMKWPPGRGPMSHEMALAGHPSLPHQATNSSICQYCSPCSKGTTQAGHNSAGNLKGDPFFATHVQGRSLGFAAAAAAHAETIQQRKQRVD